MSKNKSIDKAVPKDPDFIQGNCIKIWIKSKEMKSNESHWFQIFADHQPSPQFNSADMKSLRHLAPCPH